MNLPRLRVVDHPLLKRAITTLRRVETSHGTFRRVLREASAILAYEALRRVALREERIRTPLEETTGYEVAGDVIVIPILRAGLSMVDGFVQFVPEARIGHLGMYRDETTHQPVDYYAKTPIGLAAADVYLVDPMLATGGSAVGALHHLRKAGAQQLTFVCLIAAPEGITAVHEAFPDVEIVAASVDRELDGNKFIRPGLGDAGDRTFGTLG